MASSEQRWQRLGHLFAPPADHPWLHSHAANPCTLALDVQGRYRIFFNYRDGIGRSALASVDWELPSGLLGATSPSPLLLPGAPGDFDDSGASLGNVVAVEDGLRFYYMGWNLGVTVPWRNSIGLASGPYGGACVRQGRAPLLDRSEEDPYSLSYPWVLRDAKGWRMWYGSNLAWGPEQCSMRHVIKQAYSIDGLHWKRDSTICLDLQPGEIGLSRPCVHVDAGRYRMWYAIRSERYRIGYAESEDGTHWQRMDEALHWLGESGAWESDEQTYPCVLRHGGAWYMLYNGNRYGATGFGWARLLGDGETWKGPA